MKNVLVIGGSMFTGRVFSIQASKNGGFELHVVNRGNYPMSLERVTQYKCDRHEPQIIANLVPDITYDALVDFCAYNPGEIDTIIGTLGKRIQQYIFFSTASVCVPADGFLDESAPTEAFGIESDNPISGYISNKIKLEQELAEACSKAGIRYTILRPSFIYGPFNYAPRESFFIELIAKKQAVPVPIDSHSRFSFVYVLDVADALMKCIDDERAYDEIFNLAGIEAVTYPMLISDLERCNKSPFETYRVTIEQAEMQNLPLPFPLIGDTLYSGQKFSKIFGFNYTPFSEGMEKTFKVFYSLHTN